MIIIPAIDLKDGRCVRLKQGRMSQETVYSHYPAETAGKFVEKGAERIHLVDLDGAIQGRPVNLSAITDIVHAVHVPVQLGGGIRDIKTIEDYLALGIEWVILGTGALSHPELVRHASKEFAGHVMLGIDAKEGQVAIEGWTKEAGCSPGELAKKYENEGISAIIYTDIHRDGMGVGPNIEGTKALAESITLPVIASGGISGIEDVERILELSRYGIAGMITGRALYEKTLDLEEAIRLTKHKKQE